MPIIYIKDANGNITKFGNVTYEYDKIGRLIRENNSTLDKTFVWCYDTSGNILSRTEYDYTIGDLTNVAPTATFAYEYESGWKDKLTSFAGQPIVYVKDILPVLYKNMHLGWSRNGLLTTVSTTNTAIAMQYNASGVRFRKVVLGTGVYSTTDYTYAGNKLVRETKTGTLASTKTYLYNSQGIIGFVQDGAEYIYHKNIFGDIVAIYQGATKVAEYAYDAFGNCTVIDPTTGLPSTSTEFIGNVNPFRYRGYYYDTDLNLYYLMSRYYDPQTGRFINVDSLEHLDPVSIGGMNLCTYARNNPVGITYVTSKESNSDRESNFIVNSIAGHISSANSNKIDAFFTTENTSELILGVTDASLSIRSLYTSVTNLANHISYFSKNLEPFSLDMMQNGISTPNGVLAFNQFNWGLDKAAIFGVVFSVGLDILDSLHRGVSAEGVVLGAALTAAKGILLIYVNKGIIYLATTIGGLFGPAGAVVGYVIGALICCRHGCE